MRARARRELRSMEGRAVHLAIAGGARIDDAALVSAGPRTVWVYTNGEDVFVPVERVVDAWESMPHRAAA